MFKSDKLTNLRKYGFIALLIVIAGVIGYSIASDSTPSPSQSPNTVTVDAPAYKAIKYPDSWMEDKVISSEANQLHVISSASRKSPDAAAFVRVEDVEQADDFDINKSADEIVQSLTSEIENFSLTEKKVVKIGDYDSIQVKYKQLDEQYILVVVPRPTEAYYLTIKSKVADFEKINSDIESTVNSLASYIASKQ